MISASSSLPANRRDLRFAIGCLLLAFLVLLVRSSYWQGMLIPVRVSGGSMAETYLGEHVNIRCSRCQLPFRVDLGPWQSRSQSICPNCQQSLDETHAVSQASGQRVLIDRAAYYFSSPARFEVIAFREPKTNDLAMKRVIALPHERWEFCHGDLFINNELVRKTPRQFMETAALVHDNEYREKVMASRWQADSTSSGWKLVPHDFVWRGKQATADGWQGEGVDWLVYHHAPHHPAASVAESPVADVDAYNTTLSRPLQTVTDLILQGTFQLSANAKIHFRLHDGYETHELQYSAKTQNSLTLHSFLFGLCDRTLWLLIDGQVIERKELKVRNEPPQCMAQPLAIGGAGEGAMQLSSLRVLRDIHYLNPRGLTDTWQPPQPLKPHEYAVLGDNQPLSIDSRHWNGIARERILGRVLNWSGRIQEKEPLINAHVR